VGYGIKWYSDEDMLNELPLTTELIDGTTYYAANTSGDCQILTLAVTVSIYEHLLPPYTSTTVELCVVENTLTLADLTGYVSGTDLQWYGSQYGNDPLPMTTPLVSGTTYWISQGFGKCESDRSYITPTLNEHLILPAPEIASPITLCESIIGTITLNDLPIGAMQVQWYAEDGTTPLEGTEVLMGNAIYYAALLSGECEGTAMTEVSVEFEPVIYTTPDVSTPMYLCEHVTINDLHISNVVWFYSFDDTAPLAGTHVLETHSYYVAVAIGNCQSTMRMQVDVVINPENYDYTYDTQGFCEDATLANINVTGYGIKWFAEPEMVTELPITTALVDGVTYYAVNTSGDCMIKNLAVTVSLSNYLLPPTVQSIVDLCSVEAVLTLADIPAEGQNVVWYETQYSGTPLPMDTPLADGAIYWAAQNAGSCESERSYVSVNIDNFMTIPAPEIEGVQYFCRWQLYLGRHYRRSV